jgi:glycosyltransferase involved in cell wall biosynthesis
MISISLCLIVKDETTELDNCLKSIKDAVDEIIIVQTRDSWPTKKIANKYGAKTYNFTWINDFAAARNFAFSKATKDYILWLDADDIMPPDQLVEFKKVKQSFNTEVDCLMMDYVVNFDENGVPQFKVARERLVKRSKNLQWKGAIHEYIDVPSDTCKIGSSPIYVVHTPNRKEPNGTRNLDIYEGLKADGRLTEARDYYHYANELNEHGRFEDAIVQYKHLLTLSDCWAEHAISACNIMAQNFAARLDYESAFMYSFKTFEYAPIRAEAACQISSMFATQQKSELAIFWGQMALSVKRPEYQPIAVEHCWTTTPHSILASVFAGIGHLEAANFHNEKFLEFKPTDPAGLANRQVIQEAIERSKQPQVPVITF